MGIALVVAEKYMASSVLKCLKYIAVIVVFDLYAIRIFLRLESGD